MLIGVDFDNTIVCYDELFHKVALEQGLIPPDTPASKGVVRDYLRRGMQEDLWTELQGYVYGARMPEADPFPGVMDFFRCCRQAQVTVCIISHRTRYPYRGEKHDLHQAARDWLASHGFHDPQGIGLPTDRVHLELSNENKLTRIAAVGCSHFIDDLPEFLAAPGFPAQVCKILFDPNGLHADCPGCQRAVSWPAVGQLLQIGEAPRGR